MIITTPQELRMYLPTHVVESLDHYAAFIDNSEHDFLLERIGKPLYEAMCEKYDEEPDKDIFIPQGQISTPWQQLIRLCQRPVAFDMLYRAADVSAISVNESGLNILDTEGYDNADDKTIDRYKRRLNTEAHRGIDRLLTVLEEWAEEVGSIPEGEEPNDDQQTKREIIVLWRKSRYYYLAEGLFINTAREFNEFIDIYESREKFITLLPDLRYVSEFVLRPELGDALTDDLLTKKKDGKLNDTERKAVRLAQYALALKVEERSSMFKRPEAKDEAIGAMRRLIEYLIAAQGSLDAEAVKTAPFYVEPKPAPSTPQTPAEPWRNNRRGSNRVGCRPID